MSDDQERAAALANEIEQHDKVAIYYAGDGAFLDAADKDLIAAALRAYARPADVPEPVYKSVERILDEESAWVARPNDEVTKRVALAAVVAAHTVMTSEIDVAPDPARPAPADLREAAADAAYDATRLEDGTPQFAAAGFTLGHAAKIADAILSLLPQTQAESDIKTAVLRDLLCCVAERIELEREKVPAMADGGEPREAVLEYRRGIGWGLRIAGAMICGKIGEIGRLDRAAGKEG